MSHDRNLLIGTLAAVAAALLFSSLGALSRFSMDAGVDGVAFTAWRALFGSAALGAVVVLRGGLLRAARTLADLETRGRVALLSVAIMGLTLNVAIFTAFGRIPIALALMLFYTYPAGVALVDVVLGREPATGSRFAALGLASAGVVLVLAGSLDLSGGPAPDLLGIALALGAAASQVVFVTVSRGGYRSVPADAATSIILLVSVVGSIPIAVIAGQAAGLTAPFQSPDAWPILLVSGVLAAGLSSLLFLSAIRRIGGTRTGILMLLEPVAGVLLAGLLLDEGLAPIQAVGGALVLAGALVLQLSSARDRESTTVASSSPMV